jgi:alpha-2-macroglobulin
MNPYFARLFIFALLVTTAVSLIACREPRVEIVEVLVTATPQPAAVAADDAAASARAQTRLLQISPTGSRLTERRPEIRLTFNQPMNRESVSRALSINPAVPFSQSWQENELLIHFQEPLIPGESYTIALDQTAESVSGTPLDKSYSQVYRLPQLVEGSHFPGENNRRTPLTIRFNYPLDEASLTQSLAFDPPLDGTLSLNQYKTLATFRPAGGQWPSSQRYTIQFGQPLVDTHGDPLPLPEPISFNTPPPILSRSPAGQAVHPAQPLEIVFDRLVDEEKTAAALTIEPETAGRIFWQETSLIFQPDRGHFAPNTRYTVTLDPGAAGRDGEPLLLETYQWSFTTGALVPIASFGWGPNAQVLHTDGRRALQYALSTPRNRSTTATVTFTLYELTPTQFLDRYSSGFRGVAGWENEPISTEDATLRHTWSETAGESVNEWVNIQEVQIPDDVPPGLYVLNLETGYLNDQLLLILTEHRLTVKQAGEQLVTWVTGGVNRAVSDVEVTVYTRDGQPVDTGHTDAQGIYRTRVATDPQPLIVVAQAGSDISVSGLSNEWRQGTNPWGGWWLTPPAADDFAIYSYTDRPIYQPGQTVYFKAIVRQDDDAVLDLLPAGSGVTARIRDSRNNVLQTFDLATNHFGTVHGQFLLAEGVALGNYALEIVVDGQSHRQTFKVEDYRKPDYQVTITTDADYYLADDRIAVTVESSYYFGEPVAGAEVVVNLYHQGQTYWWDSHSEPTVWYMGEQRAVRGRTDENGRFTFSLPATLSYYTQSDWLSNLETGRLGIEVTIDDGSHQTVSGLAIVTVYNVAETLQLDTGSYVQTPDQPFTVRASVSDLAGQPVDGRSLTLSLRRYSQASYGYDTVVQSASLTTGADGRATLPFTIAEPGYYQLRLKGTDRFGNEIYTNRFVYAFSDDLRGSWFSREDRHLAITADRDSYAPGDTAELLIESTFDGPALLTFERASTRRELLVELTAPLTRVPITIRADDVPNIFVTVNAWQEQDTTLRSNTTYSLADARLHVASTELDVPASDKILAVTITPDKESYAPREEATFTLRVTNWQGIPVSAELSLALVDEAIFALSQELAGPIYDGFYAPRPNIVRTYHSLAPVRDLYAGGLGGGGNGMAGNPRSDFPDTAVWFPVLHTDANGEVSVSLTLPDTLTSWRLTAKATTADTQVGQTTHNITVRQDVVVRPILPRSLTAGDQAQVSALVHNYSERSQTLTVTLASIDEALLRLSTPPTQTISLAAGEVRVVGWGLTAEAAGEAQLLTRVLSGTETLDTVQLPLAIRPLAVPDVTSQIGQFRGELATTVNLPADALPLSSVRIELSRSIAGTLLEGLDYLTGFPYGCVEQTMSLALPNAVVGRAFNQLGVGNPALMADLPPKINAGLQRLYGFQHNDGGWGWWYDDRTDAYQTAWVVFGLAVTAEAGYEVDAQVIERGADWLQSHLDTMPPALQAYALYAMTTAGYGDLDTALALLPRHADMDSFSQAALALTLHRLGATAGAREVLATLAETAVTSQNGRVYWPAASGDGLYDRKTMASDTRSTALALSAFTAIQPDSDLIPGMVAWLVGQRRQQGWGTTNETAHAVIALTDHLLATSFSEAAIATGYTVLLNGQPVASGSLGRGEPAVTLEIPAGLMRPGSNSLRIQQSGSGDLYYAINNRVYREQAEIGAAGSIQVNRTYLDPATGRPITTTVAGQLVQVQLEVRLNDQASFMLVEDYLPGGLEALNENLNTTSYSGTAQDQPARQWQALGYNYKEVRSDRVTFFITEIGNGRHTFSYMARATHAGHFVALPAEAYPMYDLAIWGRSASSVLLVVE